MPYSDVRERLRREVAPKRLVALPDGSVDRYYRVHDGREHVLDTREALGAVVSEGVASSLRVEQVAASTGGQAVNSARQLDALGEDVVLFGHLDDPRFESLPFETRSMGDPASVDVYVFEDDEFLLSHESDDLLTWTLADLRDLDGGESTLRSADGVVCGNWVSIPEMDRALRDLGDGDFDGLVVFDPGDLTGSAADALAELERSLADLAASCRVVLSANDRETAYLLDGVDVGGESRRERLSRLCERTGIEAAVVHETDRATLVDARSVVSVPNLEAPRVHRRTGAGDRFNGGLAHGLVRGWDPEFALACGNVCASYHVVTAETADREALVEFLDAVSLPDA